MTTIARALQDAIALLGSSQRIDAEILLGHVLKKPRAYLYSWPEKELSPERQHSFDHLIAERARGLPVAYLIASKEFWSLPLQVNHHVLIPRPETELLVEMVLKKLDDTAVLTVADIGTGSGAIALALAHERPHWQITAVDISLGALEVAANNATHLQKKIEFLHGSYCEPLQTQCDAIISNPPYLAKDDPHLQQGDLRFEPPGALIAEENGLAAFQTIARQALTHLKPGGFLFFEHGYQQARAVQAILSHAGFSQIETCLDLSNHERVTFGLR